MATHEASFIDGLIGDVRGVIFSKLDLPSRVSLSLTCKFLRSEVSHIYWTHGQFPISTFMDECASHGYLGLLDLARGAGAQMLLTQLKLALEFNHEPVAIWLAGIFRSDIQRLGYSTVFFQLAIRNNNPNLISLFPMELAGEVDDILAAIASGNFALASAIRKEYYEDSWRSEPLDDSAVIRNVAEFRLEVAEAFYNFDGWIPKTEQLKRSSMIQDLFKGACLSGNESVMLWALKNLEFSPQSGQVPLDRKVLPNVPDDFGLLNALDLKRIALVACRNPTLEVLNWLIERGLGMYPEIHGTILEESTSAIFSSRWEPENKWSRIASPARFEWVQYLVTQGSCNLMYDNLIHMTLWANFEQIQWLVSMAPEKTFGPWGEQFVTDHLFKEIDLRILGYYLDNGLNVDRYMLTYLCLVHNNLDSLNFVLEKVGETKLSIDASLVLARFCARSLTYRNEKDLMLVGTTHRFRAYNFICVVQWFLVQLHAEITAQSLRPLRELMGASKFLCFELTELIPSLSQ